MKVTLESTTKIVTLETPTGAVPARVWEGFTESGIACHAFVTRIAVHKHDDSSQFERELGGVVGHSVADDFVSTINEKLGLKPAGKRTMMKGLPSNKIEAAKITSARCPICQHTGARPSKTRPGALYCTWCNHIWELA